MTMMRQVNSPFLCLLFFAEEGSHALRRGEARGGQKGSHSRVARRFARTVCEGLWTP